MIGNDDLSTIVVLACPFLRVAGSSNFICPRNNNFTISIERLIGELRVFGGTIFLGNNNAVNCYIGQECRQSICDGIFKNLLCRITRTIEVYCVKCCSIVDFFADSIGRFFNCFFCSNVFCVFVVHSCIRSQRVDCHSSTLSRDNCIITIIKTLESQRATITCCRCCSRLCLCICLNCSD